MIGYLIQQELGNELLQESGSRRSSPSSRSTRPIRPSAIPQADRPDLHQGGVGAARRGEELGAKPDGDSFRRSSPVRSRRIFGIEPVEWLLDHDCVVICAGGGGIPVMYTDEPAPAGRQLVGVEAVIDKDLASALLAKELQADALAIVTDVDAVYSDWGTPDQRAIRRATPDALADSEFAAGSMGLKVRAACSFAEETGGWPRSARSPTRPRSSAVKRHDRDARRRGIELAEVA